MSGKRKINLKNQSVYTTVHITQYTCIVFFFVVSLKPIVQYQRQYNSTTANIKGNYNADLSSNPAMGGPYKHCIGLVGQKY